MPSLPTFIVAMAMRFRSELHAPLVFTVVAFIIGFCAYILIDEAVFGTLTAFKFTLVIVGALGTQMLLAAAIRAYMTMLLMLLGNFFLTSLAAHVLNAASFKDAVFENMMLGVAGSVVALLLYLMEALKPPIKFRGLTLEAAVQQLGEIQEELRRLKAGE